jgi:glutamate synthase domain-containing protein 1/glutamate synthase domain-containing protein 3
MSARHRRSCTIERLLRSRERLSVAFDSPLPSRKAEAEGGCGVIGIACSERIAGRHLLQSLRQMRNRGNGKGGGAALVGLDPAYFGVEPHLFQRDYIVALALLDDTVRAEIEGEVLEPVYHIDHVHRFPRRPQEDLPTTPPEVLAYFVRVRDEAVRGFEQEHDLLDIGRREVEDEFVYQTTFRLNQQYYASLGEKRAFVLSHGKDMLALKLVGYGEDVFHVYGLQDLKANVWIGHHRYPTKGRVWHPGGAHPFVGMHEALVHNGDFANYASVCSYLAQRNIRPMFLTDTEVSVLVFDLLHRTYGYPLEYVIEALAPTTERDFTLLPKEKQDLYQKLQTVHMHGSPDGPWFFLIAQSADGRGANRAARLIGITDTSMLRPQVFALQQGADGGPSVGFAASEKQAIDAALTSLSEEDDRFWSRADLVWNARGGSHTDGGAFIFNVQPGEGGGGNLQVTDKFGRRIEIEEEAPSYIPSQGTFKSAGFQADLDAEPEQVYESFARRFRDGTYQDVLSVLDQVQREWVQAGQIQRALALIARLIDRRFPLSNMRRSSYLSLCDRALTSLFQAVQDGISPEWAYFAEGPAPAFMDGMRGVVVDGRRFSPEGEASLANAVRRVYERGFRTIVVAHAAGRRFIANGMGPDTSGVRIEVFGSSGDYLGSGLDGAEVVVHGSGQDQLAQIMKSGKLVVHGDVGQTFMYAAKGGEVYVLGNAAGRPLINAVGKPRVVINGTCLDYLAESFMAGDALHGGGFVVLNGVRFNGGGNLEDMAEPYPGGNLFSLSSGGAIFIRDPRGQVGEEQLNGGRLAAFRQEHWRLIQPMLKENERLFGIPIDRLLTVDGRRHAPEDVYRAVVPSEHEALQPEEAWIKLAGEEDPSIPHESAPR